VILRRSVLIRLAVVSLLVAACSIAATAWLTTTSTQAKFSGDQKRTLDADNAVYNDLGDFGRAHATWDGVQAIIDGFAPDADRTITLAAADGSIIATNDPQRQHMPAGAVPTAIVDPLSAALTMPPETTSESGVVDLSADASSEVFAVDQPAPEPVTLPQTMRTVVPTLDESLPAAAFELTPVELAERRQMITRSMECASKNGYPVRSGPGTFGGYVLEPTPGMVNDVFVKISIVCGGTSADLPGQRYGAINAAIVDSTSSCLTAAGITSASLGKYRSGLLSLAVSRDADPAAVAACRAKAVGDAVGAYVAPAARLYLASPPVTRSWFSSAGGTRILLTLIVVLLVTLLAAALGARRLLRPIRSLTRAAQRMANGESQARVLVTGNDEIARLGDAFNTMAEALHSNDRQRKRLVSDIAHELRTPLANVRGYLEGAQDDLVVIDGELVESLLDETLQLQHLIDDLQDLALADAGQLRIHPEQTDVTTLVERSVAAHRAAADKAGITIAFAGDEPLPLSIDPVRIKQAVGNLLTNAIRYTPRGGHVEVALRAPDGDQPLRIDVADSGIGISADDLPHLFDRFFRADTSRSRSTGGSGLGLAVTRHLVEAHGGSIDVHSTLGSGSQFTIALPALVGAN